MLYTFRNRCNLRKFVYIVFYQRLIRIKDTDATRLKDTDATRDISYWCLQGGQK